MGILVWEAFFKHSFIVFHQVHQKQQRPWDYAPRFLLFSCVWNSWWNPQTRVTTITREDLRLNFTILTPLANEHECVWDILLCILDCVEGGLLTHAKLEEKTDCSLPPTCVKVFRHSIGLGYFRRVITDIFFHLVLIVTEDDEKTFKHLISGGSINQPLNYFKISSEKLPRQWRQLSG